MEVRLGDYFQTRRGHCALWGWLATCSRTNMKAFLISPNHQTQGADLTVVEVEHNADGDARLKHVRALLDCEYVQMFDLLAWYLPGGPHPCCR